jgi:hypothetical protein
MKSDVIYEIATASGYGVALVVIICWHWWHEQRTKRSLAFQDHWPLRRWLFACLCISTVSRAAMSLLNAPATAINCKGHAVVLRALLAQTTAIGFWGNWASYMLLACFYEEVRRSTSHQSPERNELAVLRVRRLVGVAIALGLAASIGTCNLRAWRNKCDQWEFTHDPYDVRRGGSEPTRLNPRMVRPVVLADVGSGPTRGRS